MIERGMNRKSLTLFFYIGDTLCLDVRRLCTTQNEGHLSVRIVFVRGVARAWLNQLGGVRLKDGRCDGIVRGSGGGVPWRSGGVPWSDGRVPWRVRGRDGRVPGALARVGDLGRGFGARRGAGVPPLGWVWAPGPRRGGQDPLETPSGSEHIDWKKAIRLEVLWVVDKASHVDGDLEVWDVHGLLVGVKERAHRVAIGVAGGKRDVEREGHGRARAWVRESVGARERGFGKGVWCFGGV